jgi:biopolymer transport protein ExbB
MLARVWQQLRNKELQGEQLKDLRDSSPLGYILAAGISNSGHGRDIMKDSIEEAAGQIIH